MNTENKEEKFDGIFNVVEECVFEVASRIRDVSLNPFYNIHFNLMVAKFYSSAADLMESVSGGDFDGISEAQFMEKNVGSLRYEDKN